MSSDRRYTAYTIMEMKTRTITPILTGFLAACALGGGAAGLLPAQSAPETPVLKIEAGKPGPAVNLRYGMMTEEINFSYDGGLYGELVRNRSFKEDAKDPVHWSLVQEGGAAATEIYSLSAASRKMPKTRYTGRWYRKAARRRRWRSIRRNR